jgi:hypothetical protein
MGKAVERKSIELRITAVVFVSLSNSFTLIARHDNRLSSNFAMIKAFGKGKNAKIITTKMISFVCRLSTEADQAETDEVK